MARINPALRRTSPTSPQGIKWLNRNKRANSDFIFGGERFWVKTNIDGSAVTIFKLGQSEYERFVDLLDGQSVYVSAPTGEVSRIMYQRGSIDTAVFGQFAPRVNDVISSNIDALFSSSFYADADIRTNPEGVVYLEKQINVDQRDGLLNMPNLSSGNQGHQRPNLTIRFDGRSGQIEVAGLGQELIPQWRNICEVVNKYNAMRNTLSQFYYVDRYGRNQRNWPINKPTTDQKHTTVLSNQRFLAELKDSDELLVSVNEEDGAFITWNMQNPKSFIRVRKNKKTGRFEITDMSQNLRENWGIIAASLR